MKVNYGFILLKTGKLDEAQRILQECVSQGRSEDEKNLAKSNLALVLWKKGQLDQAISMLQEVIVKYKTTAIYGSLGYMLIEKGDLDEALKFNLEALIQPENAIILDMRLTVHLRGNGQAENYSETEGKRSAFPRSLVRLWKIS